MRKRVSLVTQRELTLLLNSKIIEDYPWLRDFLKQNYKIKKRDLEEQFPELKNFFDNIFPRLIKQASEEWESDDESPIDMLEGNDRIPCELCHQPIKYLCIISNKFTQQKLTVGSECVKHFGINLGKPVSQLIKEIHRTKRLTKLNNSFPGIDKTIDFWDEEMDKYPIVIPEKLEKPYLSIGKEIKTLYNNYLNKAEKKQINEDENIVFGKIAILLKKKDNIQKDIEKYVKENLDKKYIPGREIAKWIKRNGDTVTLTWLKKDGKITLRTAFRIEEPSFMKFISDDLNGFLADLGIEIEKIDTDFKGKRGYVIIPSSIPRIRFFCPHRDLVFKYGGILFGEKLDYSLNIESIINMCKIYDDNSIDQIIKRLSASVKSSRLVFYEHDVEYNELIIFEKSSGKYIITELIPIAENFKSLALGIGENANKFVQYILKLPGKRYSKLELNDLKELRKKFGK